MPEEIQEIGRQGAAKLKRWLEATTYFELPFDAYNNKIDCMVETFGGEKQFDLVGYTVSGERTPVYVESKTYTSPSGQYKEFMKFLSIAYSHTAKEQEKYGSNRKSSYFWITFHPFNLDNWSKLETFAHMKKALTDYPEHVGQHTVDDNLVAQVSSRVAVLVFNPKQEAWTLSRTELELIRPTLARKVVTL